MRISGGIFSINTISMGTYILLLSLIAIIFIALFAFYCELFLREYKKANNHRRAVDLVQSDALRNISHNVRDLVDIAEERGRGGRKTQIQDV